MRIGGRRLLRLGLLIRNKMAKKNGAPKSRWKRIKGCGCYLCNGKSYLEYIKLKYNIKPKHKLIHSGA